MASITALTVACLTLEGRTSHPSADEDAHLIEPAHEVLVDMRELRRQMDP